MFLFSTHTAAESNLTDTELKKWWPDLGTVVTELRQIGHSAVVDQLVDAVRAAATAGEILDSIVVLLRENRALRSQLNTSAASAWDRVLADVDWAYPGSSFGHWLNRFMNIAK